MFFVSMVCTICFHLLCVAGLFAPFTFRAAMAINPAFLGFTGALPHSRRGFLGGAVFTGCVGLFFRSFLGLWVSHLCLYSLSGFHACLALGCGFLGHCF